MVRGRTSGWLGRRFAGAPRVACGLLAAWLAVGCGGGGGGDDDDDMGGVDAAAAPDAAGAPDAAPPPDAALPPDAATRRTINITGSVRYVTDSGEVTRPIDFSSATIEALVPDGAGDFDVYSGTGAVGSASIPDVPAGTRYYLRVNDRYLVTGASTVDLSRVEWGRPDATASGSGSTITFNVTGLGAWNALDELQIISSNLGEVAFADDDLTNGPAVGATALAGATYDWSGRPLIQGTTAGDRLAMTQLSSVTTGGLSYRVATKFYTAPSFEQSSGVGTTLSGAFADIVRDGTASFDWRRSQFASLVTDANPRAQHGMDYLYVSPLPKANVYGPYGNAPDLLQIFLGEPVDDVNTGTLNFGNPFGSGWDVLGQVYTAYSTEYSVGTASPGRLYCAITQTEPIATFATNPIRPRVGPIGNFAIDGSSAFDALLNVGLTPTLSWSPPSVGDADYYGIDVYKLGDVGGETRFAFVASLVTRDTELQIPPGVLQPLGSYVFLAGAFRAPGRSIETAPYSPVPSFASACSMSEPMVP